MHIPDGILPLPVTLGGYAVCLGALWLSLNRINKRPDPKEDIPRASLLTAGFFAASLIHVPIPPGSVHLVLNGLLGVLLGYYAIPAILIGLFFQAVMFGHGGLTTLGVNGVIMGLPALMAHYIFRLRNIGSPNPRRTSLFAFIAGAVATLASVVLFAVILFTFMPAHLSRAAERSAILIFMAAHTPLVLIEGLITALIAAFLLRVRPEILHGV
jgi:cobalt/nickel transport system permease protein